MVHLRQIELADVITKLPDIQQLHVGNHFRGRKDDLFLCALGFEDRCLEDRCLYVPEAIAEAGGYECSEVCYFEYSTNRNDNDINRTRLVTSLGAFSNSLRSVPCDATDFPSVLRDTIARICTEKPLPSVAFDVSVCSARLLLLVLKVLFEFDVSLCITYGEAAIYHPTREEYDSNRKDWTTEEWFGTSRGVGTVIPSPEHPGNRLDRLQDAVVVFPTFKSERAKAVISDVDPSLAMTPGDRVIWIVGEPHLPENHWRIEAIKEINKIQPSAPLYVVSTFDYKRTIETLELIYQPRDCRYHVTIAPLGSKMQSLGIALFWYMRQDVSIIFATPKEYNALQYSEDCRGHWLIQFGELAKIRNFLDSVGQIQVV